MYQEISKYHKGALEYESDGHVPTGERKQAAFGVGFIEKKGSLCVDPKEIGLFWCELPETGGNLV